MAKIRQVALAFPFTPPHLARVLYGITDYARERGNWVITASPDTYSASVVDLKGWPGDGIIASIETEPQARAAQKMGVPVVNVSGALGEIGLPRVTYDNEAAGRLAAEHLLDSGFQRFGYYGPQGIWYAEMRRRGFIERIARAGGQYSILEVTTSAGPRRAWHYWLEPLKRWLKTLTLPVGVMAAFDVRASMVVEACNRLGLRVPYDVAVIGVDNHEATCEFCQVPLTSISRNDRKVGYEAAALLDRIMSGKKRPKKDVLIQPEGVVRRLSTDVLAIEDPHVAVAARYIREHIGEPFGVKKLLTLVPISRRWLEQRFKESLGVTLHEYICRVRVERAKQLLAEDERIRLYQVCAACGFSDPKRFRLMFQRFTGTTPAEHRRSCRRG